MNIDRSWTARLLADSPLAPLVRHLTFEVDGPEGFHWLPGQYVELFSPSVPAERFPYSVASAQQPSDPGRFELAVRSEGSGRLVDGLQVGDSISVSAPRGSFVRRGSLSRPAVFVAVGTGVAPVRAMIQGALAEASNAQLVLLFGCRSEQDLLWATELRELTSDPRFLFLPTLSQPSATWSGKRGYVQEHMDELRGLVPEADFFVCGSKTMIREAEQRLRELGVSPDRLRVEGY